MNKKCGGYHAKFKFKELSNNQPNKQAPLDFLIRFRRLLSCSLFPNFDNARRNTKPSFNPQKIGQFIEVHEVP
jgi:hypothetical protein